MSALIPRGEAMADLIDKAASRLSADLPLRKSEWRLSRADRLADLITDAFDVDAPVERAAGARYQQWWAERRPEDLMPPWSEMHDQEREPFRRAVRPIVLAALGRAS